LLEADEAFGTFLRLSMRGLLVTNVEADHLDFYETPENLLQAFQDVAQRIDGPIVVCADDEGARQVHRDAITYGFGSDCDWRIDELADESSGATFWITQPSGDRFPVALSKPGRHMALNATGVVALMAQFGFDPQTMAAGLADFAGVGRRYELRGTIGGVEVIDDYAHHPTEIEATVVAARAGHPQRLVVAFQPHRYTRTAEHGEGLGRALASADVVVIADVYSAHELPIPGVSGETVARAAEAAGAHVVYEPTRSALAKTLAEVVEPGDRLLTLGAGDITQLPDELFEVMTGRPSP
jgi:UDP-N-acetylmuramate--alanine ligase